MPGSNPGSGGAGPPTPGSEPTPVNAEPIPAGCDCHIGGESREPGAAVALTLIALAALFRRRRR